MPGHDVLIAEDDGALRGMLADVFVKAGYRVTEVASGHGMFEVIATHSFSLIISDVLMPGFTGLEVVEAMRADPDPTPVILMSAYAGPDLHARARRLGAVAFDKPFDIDDLLAVARELTREAT